MLEAASKMPLEELQRLRREKAQLKTESETLMIGEHENARDGVDYRYMRAVRIQSIDREIAKLLKENIRVV